jgi:hypothetical protein
MPRSFPRSLILALAALALGCARAAELGEPRVSSHIGQQLVADIELTSIDNPAAKVAVRLADLDVYRGANILMPEVLSSLNMSVMQRDGRQFLHVTSLMPVNEDHLHLYLELTDGGHRSVRLATLWLTPDPHPAPRPLPAPVEEPRPVPPAPVVRAPVQPAPVRRPPKVAAAPARESSEAKACLVLDAKNAALRNEIGRLEQKVKTLQSTTAAKPMAASVNPVRSERTASARRQPKKRVEPADDGFPWITVAVSVLALAGAAAALYIVLRRRALKAKRARAKSTPDA